MLVETCDGPLILRSSSTAAILHCVAAYLSADYRGDESTSSVTESPSGIAAIEPGRVGRAGDRSRIAFNAPRPSEILSTTRSYQPREQTGRMDMLEAMIPIVRGDVCCRSLAEAQASRQRCDEARFQNEVCRPRMPALA